MEQQLWCGKRESGGKKERVNKVYTTKLVYAWLCPFSWAQYSEEMSETWVREHQHYQHYVYVCSVHLFVCLFHLLYTLRDTRYEYIYAYMLK